MQWELTPRVKIYEALGVIAHGRVEADGNLGKVYSSSGNKFYTITYNPEIKAIMVNDNASFYKEYLGYPAIAYLMFIGEIRFDMVAAEYLKNIPWKDINQKFKNDFEKAVEFTLKDLGVAERERIEKEVDHIYR